jgi:hypothetical protein
MSIANSARRFGVLLLVPLLLVACGGDRDTAASAAPVDARPATSANGATAAAENDGALPVVHVFKTPTCGCCADWVDHIEAAGFTTEVTDLPDLTAVRQRAGVPNGLASCHTALVGDYVIEGHVPASTMKRLLQERPEAAGISVPGMPMGSPGMEGPWKDAYDVILFTRDGRGMVYESH